MKTDVDNSFVTAKLAGIYSAARWGDTERHLPLEARILEI